tara:strand:+ start:180 stop:1202 length:1023 start_codon:yes stop_codon:yes gene_type:complete
MELYERESLVAKIVLGNSRLRIKKDLTLIVYPLTIEKNFLAQETYGDSYDDALFSGVYTRNEMLKILKESDVWTEEQDKELLEIADDLDKLKVRFFDNFFLPISKEIRKEIQDLEREQSRLHEIKHANDHLDCEGIASYSRWSWIIENSTFCEDGEPYDFSHVDASTVLRYYHQNRTPQEKIRELARTLPWRNIWSNCNQIPKDAFSRKPNELSEEQSALLDWTRLYDNIAESSEPPEEAVIKSDYALDGWLIKQKNKREKERMKSKHEGVNNKHHNADEVFVMSRSKEESKEIYELNDAQSRMVVKSRAEELKDGEAINYRDFKDVKAKTMNEANAKFG